MLHGYRQLCSLRKNRSHLHRHCKKYWNKIWYFKHHLNHYLNITLPLPLPKPLPKGKNKKVIGLIKDELGGKIMKEFVGIRAKTYSYLKDNNEDKKKSEGTKKCVIKRKFKFKDYKSCLGATQLETKITQLAQNVDII